MAPSDGPLMRRGFTVAEWDTFWLGFWGDPLNAEQRAYIERCKANDERMDLQEMRRLARPVEAEEREAIQAED